MFRTALGPQIGTHLGKPIYKTVENDGTTYIFDRLAECDSEGCPLDQLASNEMLLPPGLIYRKAS